MLHRGALLLLALVALAPVALAPSLANAQGLGRGLDSPTGTPRTAPPASAIPPAPAPLMGGDEVVPPPPGGGYVTATNGLSPTSVVEGESAAVLTRMRALDASLAAIAASGGPDYVRAILSILAGSASVAFGVIALELDEPVLLDMAPYLFVLGGTTIVRAVLSEFVLRPDGRDAAREYALMPTGTHAERMARIEFGEEQLSGLAEQALIARMVDGSISIAGALAVIPAYLLPRDFDARPFDPLDALVFLGPAIALVTGIITFASPSGVEQRWDAYKELRERLGAEAALDRVSRMATAPTVDFGVAAGPNGGMATVGGRF